MAPVVKLRPTVIPTSIMRCTVLGDFMTNFGLPPDVVRLAQQGFAAGDITGITINGLGYDNYIRDQATLMFADLTTDHDVSVDVSEGRSMIEAVSVKFAHAVAYSIATMKRNGLQLAYHYHFAYGRADPANVGRYGLSYGHQSSFAPGTAPRQLFSINPGLDRGITYSHATAYRIK